MSNRPLLPYRVHIGGVGRIGTNVAMGLHEAGIAEITCNDPQTFGEEQLEVCSFSRRSDLGRPKVHVLERYFDGRPNLTFVPVVARNQDPVVAPYLEQANLIVSCANQLHARIHLEKEAIRLGKPIIQACAQDARTALGGLITVWRPDTRSSCFGCLFPNQRRRFRRSEVLDPTVIKFIANLSVEIGLRILGGKRSIGSNIVAVDMMDLKIDSFGVDRRSNCRVCASVRRHCSLSP